MNEPSLKPTSPYFSPYVAWYGREEAPPPIVKLKAGVLDVEFEAGELRYIAHAGTEYIRRLYIAARDHNWCTIPAQISNVSIDAQADHFQISFDALHVDGDLRFRWRATIEGRNDGSIRYQMQGTAESDFRYCRIGFCLLHPITGIAGQPYVAQTPAGEVKGELPKLVAPQTMENGFEKPIFPACSSLNVIAADGSQVKAEFEGDLFEMEDQRNWTDGSFKTYCTPLALGYPHNAQAGQHFEQQVTLRVELPRGLLKLAPQQAGAALALRVQRSEQRLPALGFGLASQSPSPRQVELLLRLQPAHLRVEVHLGSLEWPATLTAAIRLARSLNCGLEVALFLTNSPEEALRALSTLLASVPVDRIIVMHEAEAAAGTTSAHWLDVVRPYLAPALPANKRSSLKLMGGTNGNFAELNRQPPVTSLMDGVTYTLNPQVHAADERSLVEGIQAQRDTLLTAATYCGGLPLCISSVTLKPPFNQAATEEAAPQAADVLPDNVDARQMSLFAAGWTVGSLRSLAAGGAHAVTYYETIGWRGLMESEAGTPLPQQFPSTPGMVFPMYYVFAFLAEGKGAQLVEATAPTSIFVEGVGYELDGVFALAIANLQSQEQAVTLGPLPTGEVTLRRLNATTMAFAATNPEEFLAQIEAPMMQADNADFTLGPYEIIFLHIRSR